MKARTNEFFEDIWGWIWHSRLFLSNTWIYFHQELADDEDLLLEDLTCLLPVGVHIREPPELEAI